MKQKTLLLAILLIVNMNLKAQSDVTNTYLTNASFESSTALTETYLYGYGKDGSPYGFQNVTGWTYEVLAGDNSNASYPNSGMAGAVFSYGSTIALKGNNQTAPSAAPSGISGSKCLAFFAVWSCGGYYYQNVTLPAGIYTLTIPTYNKSGTQANTSYIGFIPDSGTSYLGVANTTVGSWVNQTINFTRNWTNLSNYLNGYSYSS